MGQMIAYADESARRLLTVATVVVSGDTLADLDRMVRCLQMSGQRQVHLNGERPSRRREIIDVVVGSGLVHARVYCARRPLTAAREWCLTRAVHDLVAVGVEELTLDGVDDRQAHRDRSAIRRAALDAGGALRYRHASAHQVAGIQVADIVAWAYGAGGDWRRRVRPVVRHAVDRD